MEKSKKILLLFFVLLLISVFWRFFNLLSFRDSHIELQKGALVKIQPKESISQKFSANRDGLSKIEVLLRSPGIKSKDRVSAEILDENCQNKLREGELKESFLNSENLYEFSFDRLKNSRDLELCLKLTFLPQKDTAKSLQIFRMGENENQPLSLRPVYKNENVFQDLSELNERMSQYKPWFLKHYFLYSIALGFFILSLILIFILVIF